MIPRTAAGRFKPGTLAVFIIVHGLALLIFHPYFFSWEGVVLFAVMVWLTASAGISIFYHRMLTHRSTWPKPALLYVLGIIVAMALEMGPLKWAATHRMHHDESDHEDDPHSPLVTFWWSHLLWMLYVYTKLDTPEKIEKRVPDLWAIPYLRWLNRNFAWIWLAFLLLSMRIGFLMGGWQMALSLAIWGTFFRTAWVWNVTWLVNSATHLKGYRNYKTGDDSRNLWWVAFFTFGEGWHNNHHAVAGAANFKRKWWEFDASWELLRIFRFFGWVSKPTVAAQLTQAGPSRNYTGKVPAKSPALPSHVRPQESLMVP